MFLGGLLLRLFNNLLSLTDDFLWILHWILSIEGGGMTGTKSIKLSFLLVWIEFWSVLKYDVGFFSRRLNELFCLVHWLRPLNYEILIVQEKWIKWILIVFFVVPEIKGDLLTCVIGWFRLHFHHKAVRSWILLMKQFIQGVHIKGRSVFVTLIGRRGRLGLVYAFFDVWELKSLAVFKIG